MLGTFGNGGGFGSDRREGGNNYKKKRKNRRGHNQDVIDFSDDDDDEETPDEKLKKKVANQYKRERNKGEQFYYGKNSSNTKRQISMRDTIELVFRLITDYAKLGKKLCLTLGYFMYLGICNSLFYKKI